MKVLRGFSEEVLSCKWAKADVELDDGDLEAIALSQGFDIGNLTVAQKYGILSTEAEKLLTVEYIKAVRYHRGEVPQALMERLEAVKVSATEAVNKAKKASSAGSGS